MIELQIEGLDPEEQLATDEAILLEADQSGAAEWLRLWTFACPVVVIGRSSRFFDEVNVAYCESQAIPVLRRCSGGAAVVAGPGCWMYSLVLSLDLRPELRKIDAAHRFVLDRLLVAIRQQCPEVRMQGTCDLTWNDRKFSGNSLRVAKRHVLYHGTVLHAADVALIARCLAAAPRQPDYRRGRSHADFIDNLPIDPAQLGRDLRRVFDVERSIQQLDAATGERISQLKCERYGCPAWHRRH